MSNKKTELNTKKEFSLQNKKQFFEKIKYKNFVHSSKLEGINITPINEDMVQLMVDKYGVGQDPYCYPNTKVLINKFGIKDEKILQEAERDCYLNILH